MKIVVSVGIIALGILLNATGAAAAQAGAVCPAGTPASPRPAPDFVPTPDCMGWIPSSHPLAVTAAGPTAPPAATCNVATLRGSFVFSATGFNIVSGVSQPKAILEVIEFNGDGTLSVPSATLSVNGSIVRSLPSAGTYTVDEGCTGTISFNGPTYDTFLTKKGDRISMIQTNVNTVFQGVATRNPD